MGSHSVTCHPTQVNTLHLNTGWYSIYPHQRDGMLSSPWWLVTYRDGLPAHRWSPIQVLTRQCTAGSRTRYLLVTSMMFRPLHYQDTRLVYAAAHSRSLFGWSSILLPEKTAPKCRTHQQRFWYEILVSTMEKLWTYRRTWALKVQKDATLYVVLTLHVLYITLTRLQ